MENSRCPFCWGGNIRPVYASAENPGHNSRLLMECGDCEKFFWNDTREPVFSLPALCHTLTEHPEICYLGVSGPSGFVHSNIPGRKFLNSISSAASAPINAFRFKQGSKIFLYD
ncbi:MAG: hypothetical protein ACLFVG_03575 [Candidatus Aminicenantes bacterium]